MSAGVADQRMKGQTGTPVSNVTKEQLESPGEELAESWRHQQQAAPSYATPISSTTDPYSAPGYYGTAGTPAFQYPTFNVGDGTWSTNGTDTMAFLGGYAQPDTYGMEGVFGPSTTAFSTTFGQHTSPFNYFHGNGDYSTWGGQISRPKQYDDYYRPEGHYVPDGLKAVDAGVQGLTLNDSKLDKDLKPQHDQKDTAGQPKKTWATIASQPAKPQPPMQSSGLKKKGPGMPPPPIIPGKHNMDIGTWDTSKNNGPVVTQPPPQVPLPKPQTIQPQTVVLPPQPPPGPVVTQHTWGGTAPPRAPPPRPQAQLILPQVPIPSLPPPPMQPPPAAHPVLDKLRTKNNYNPTDFDLSARDARFFVIKSYSEDDIHRSIKYEIWCSTEHGNKRLDSAYRERTKDGAQGVVYLFFSVNGSGHFCGMAQMVSPVDYKSNSSVWAQDKWKGQFKVRWIYVKDVPNMQLRHIRLENNENKPVTNSRDTQEIPHVRGVQVLRLMHTYRHSTSIFDDFVHYEKRQEEEDLRKAPDANQGQGGSYKDNHQHPTGGYESGKHHQGYDNKHDTYGGGNKGHYNRDHNSGFNRDHAGFNKEHGHSGGFHKDHVTFHKEQSGGNYKDHGNNGDGYSGYKGNRGDRDQHGGNFREHRDQSGTSGGYRSHKDRNEGSSRGGRGRGRPN